MDDSGSIYLAGETEMTPAVSISLLKCETGSNPHIFVDSVISDSAVITDVIGRQTGIAFDVRQLFGFAGYGTLV